MADAAVRVDIISGQNTVIKSVDLTRAKLLGLAGVAEATNTGFDNLSKKGLGKVSSGFKSLAFHAAGVPGPMGKIAEGALLLGGGSGVLLGVAAAAGAVAIAWTSLKNVGKDATDAIDRMTKALEKNRQAWKDIESADAATSKLLGRASFILNAAGFVPGLNAVAAALYKQAGGIRAVASAFAALEAHGATDAFLMGKWEDFDARDKADARRAAEAERVRQRQAEIARERDTGLPAQWGRNQGFTQESVILGLTQQVAALNAEMVKTPEIMAQVALALPELEKGFTGLQQEWLATLELSQQFVQEMNDVLLGGIIQLGSALADAIGGGEGFGQVLVQAFGQMMQDIGHLLIKFGVQLTLLQPLLRNPLISGPAMIAAGVLIAAAGAAVSKRAQGQQVSSHAARGGVDAGRYGQDQQALGARGTVTVTLRDGFIRPSDPQFQEFLAQVIKEARGRNVVFA